LIPFSCNTVKCAATTPHVIAMKTTRTLIQCRRLAELQAGINGAAAAAAAAALVSQSGPWLVPPEALQVRQHCSPTHPFHVARKHPATSQNAEFVPSFPPGAGFADCKLHLAPSFPSDLWIS
jgi:hypothetical protein